MLQQLQWVIQARSCCAYICSTARVVQLVGRCMSTHFQGGESSLAGEPQSAQSMHVVTAFCCDRCTHSIMMQVQATIVALSDRWQCCSQVRQQSRGLSTRQPLSGKLCRLQPHCCPMRDKRQTVLTQVRQTRLAVKAVSRRMFGWC